MYFSTTPGDDIVVVLQYVLELHTRLRNIPFLGLFGAYGLVSYDRPCDVRPKTKIAGFNNNNSNYCSRVYVQGHTLRYGGRECV